MTSVVISPSTNPKKKYMAVFSYDNGKKLTKHFGQAGANDFTITNDKEAKNRYIKRHTNSRENFEKFDSASSLSRYILWEKTSVAQGIKFYKNRFNLK